MKLYRHELGSDDDVEDVVARKKLIGDFASFSEVKIYIEQFYAHLPVKIVQDEPIENYRVMVALPKDSGIEPSDEALWLIG